MVRHTRVELVDDLDESEAVETVSFALRGTTYEIDLSEEHVSALDDFLTDYIAAARVVSGRRAGAAKPGRRGNTPTASEITGASAGEVRAWALANGYEVSPNGRIPEPIARAYLDAHS